MKILFAVILAVLACASNVEARYRQRKRCRSCQQMSYSNNGGTYTTNVSTKSVSTVTSTSPCANGQCKLKSSVIDKVQFLEVNIDK